MRSAGSPGDASAAVTASGRKNRQRPSRSATAPVTAVDRPHVVAFAVEESEGSGTGTDDEQECDPVQMDRLSAGAGAARSPGPTAQWSAS
jgi:hypothetical protein